MIKKSLLKSCQKNILRNKPGERHAENYETLTQETEDDSKKRKDTSCPQTVRINTVNMATPSKAIYRFNAIPIKIPMNIFHRTRAKNLKIYTEP